MKWLRMLVLILVVSVLLFTMGCSGGSNSYSLECNIDTEQYGFNIDGEEGPVSIQTLGESTKSMYDPNGNMISIAVEVNRTLTFEESGNSYTIVGSINIDFQTDTVKYDITTTGDTFEEPQTCKK